MNIHMDKPAGWTIPNNYICGFFPQPNQICKVHITCIDVNAGYQTSLTITTYTYKS